MDVQATKLKLLKFILENENSDFIARLAEFIRKEEGDFWNDLSEVEQKEIIQGIEELDEGKRIEYDSFLKKIS